MLCTPSMCLEHEDTTRVKHAKVERESRKVHSFGLEADLAEGDQAAGHKSDQKQGWKAEVG